MVLMSVLPDSGQGTSLGNAAGVTTDPTKSGLKADLSTTTAASIDDVRQAFNMQNFAYMLGAFGYRYVEYLKSLFGTDAGDARLQRPEFLGSGSTDILISEVFADVLDG